MIKKDKILIIDDSAVNIQILKGILSENYTLHAIRDSRNALEFVKNFNADLILLDIEMPQLNGYDVCRLLKKDPATANIPVIFVTSKNDAEAEEMGLEAGAIDYITKPFSPAIIKSRIKNHVKLKNYQDMLSELSMRDGLTGLYNKRKFEQSAKILWEKAIQEKAALSLFLIDIDYFKKYNDCYGHLEGDNCLKAVAQNINATVDSPGSVTARFGGEEFVSLLPHTEKDQAVSIAKSVLRNVHLLKIPHRESEASGFVTLSIGIATASKIPDSSNFADFLARADRLLYRAKASGRNRICAGTFV